MNVKIIIKTEENSESISLNQEGLFILKMLSMYLRTNKETDYFQLPTMIRGGISLEKYYELVESIKTY